MAVQPGRRGPGTEGLPHPRAGEADRGRVRAQALLDFRWQLTLGGALLNADEIAALSEAKRPLIRLRGRWVILDPALLERLRRPPRRRMRMSEALGAVLAGSAEIDGETVTVVADGPLADSPPRWRAPGPRRAGRAAAGAHRHTAAVPAAGRDLAGRDVRDRAGRLPGR